eukprot:4558354-Amphidinium_carterae.1
MTVQSDAKACTARSDHPGGIITGCDSLTMSGSARNGFNPFSQGDELHLVGHAFGITGLPWASTWVADLHEEGLIPATFPPIWRSHTSRGWSSYPPSHVAA